MLRRASAAPAEKTTTREEYTYDWGLRIAAQEPGAWNWGLGRGVALRLWCRGSGSALAGGGGYERPPRPQRPPFAGRGAAGPAGATPSPPRPGALPLRSRAPARPGAP